MSDSFADSVGVNVHLRYLDTTYGLYDTRVKPRLQELGVRHIRDGFDGYNSTFESKVLDLGNAGIKSTLIWHGAPQTAVVAACKRLRPALQAVEGPNESDLPMMGFSYNSQTFPEGTRAYQKDLYSWIKADSTLSSLPVIQASMGWGGNAPTYGNQSSSADFACGHFYTASGDAPGRKLDEWHLPYADLPTPGKIKIVTESGYSSGYQDAGGGGVSEWVQGRYVQRILTEHFRRGIERTFIYQLLDESAQPLTNAEGHFGLVRHDNTARPAFAAVKNMITLTNDRGVAFIPQSLDYTFSGGNTLLRHFLLQKRDGTFQIVVWQDPDNWDETAKLNIVVPNQNVTLTLAGKSGSVKTYVPMTGLTSSTLTLQNSAVTVGVPDHPMIIEIGALAVPTIASQPSGQSVIAGGNATFSVTASGNPMPTVQWQRAATGTTTYSNLTDGGSYSGVTTGTLTVSSTTTGMSGDQFRAVATNSQGSASSNSATLTVNATLAAPVISSSLAKSGMVGTLMSNYQITASNNPTSYGASGLPVGLSLNTTNGIISGTPTTSGTVNTTISATNSGGTGSAILVFTISATSTGSQLAGTDIGTLGSYSSLGNTRDKAFDGDITTYFDAPVANGVWAGLDLGAAYQIGQIRYHPRIGQATRMNGGIFQGSSSADFTSGVVNLHTITSIPPESYTTVAVSITSTFRYVRYLSPDAGWGNVAEVEFHRAAAVAPAITSTLTKSGTVASALNYTITASNTPTSFSASNLPTGLSVNTSTGVISGTPTAAGTTNTTISAINSAGTGSGMLVITITTAGPTKLAGTVIGTTGSLNNSGNTRDKAFDSNTGTYFDGPRASGNWVGRDLGTTYQIAQVRYHPRIGYGSRMRSGVFQGSNAADFSSGVVTLFTISSNAPDAFTTGIVTNTTPVRYVRYLGPKNSYCNVAEVEFYRP